VVMISQNLTKWMLLEEELSVHLLNQKSNHLPGFKTRSHQ
jgi:hypothetical protein